MTLLLFLYCAAILVASLAGGWVPLVVRLNHRRQELALSFVSGMLLGLALLHMLPDAWSQRMLWLEHAALEHAALEHAGSTHLAEESIGGLMFWVLAGFLGMFLLERFVCFHHHDAPTAHEPAAPGRGHEHAHGHGHGHEQAHGRELGHGVGGASLGSGHRLTWTGVAIGLTVHSMVGGAALAASTATEWQASGTAWAGFGTFLMIVLHKPFDSLTLGTLMARDGWPTLTRHMVNGLFALATPVGALMLLTGMWQVSGTAWASWWMSVILAASTGMFLCIALSDLLPELQFHRHDRLKLSAALILGLGFAWIMAGLHA